MARDSGLSVRLFGQADVSWDGSPLKFAKRATTLAMLARIVLQRGTPIARESLAFTLFPDADEATALSELRRYLYLANKTLPQSSNGPWLLVDAETVCWNLEAGAFVDTAAFERLGTDPQTQAEAVELYRGDLLEDVYDDWVVRERERFRSRYLAILGESLDRHRAMRDFASAIACAKRLLAADPWREDALRSLMAVRYESGDTAGALAEYETFAKRLRAELTIAPMPETAAMRDAILRNEALGDPRGQPSPAQAPARPAPILPFVGRGRELERLHATWSRAARGAGALVVLRGEAGVGKTRLTAELARAVHSEGGRVFVGTTGSTESAPYQAIVESLRAGLPLLLARPPSPARRAVLARLLPELLESGERGIELPEQSPERETARVFDALAHAVASLAYPRPLLLVLEDLQWAGSASIEALGAIVRQSARQPVLIVATCREEETPPHHPLRALVRSLGLFRNVEEHALERLGIDDVTDLVTRVDGLRGLGDGLAGQLFAQSEGNALFLNEIVHGLIDGGRRTGESPGSSIASIIDERIGRLDPQARTIAEIAAIAGPGCSVALVREVSNLPAAAVTLGFNELLESRILREAGSREGYDYAFTHHLIASAVYDGVEPSLRSQRHYRIARVFEAEGRAHAAASPREIGRHYESAGDAENASRWYLDAARQAASVHAYGDAVELATRALEHQQNPELRHAALDVRERARGRRGDRDGQRRDIDALALLAGDDPRAAFDVLARRVLLARSLGEIDEEGRLISAMESAARTLGDDAEAQTLVHRAAHFGQRSEQSAAIRPAAEALAIYERIGDARGQFECLYLLVQFSANTGDIDASRRYLALMSERAANLSDQVVEARALDIAAVASLLRQEYRDSFDLTTRALALHLATSDREGEAAARGRLAVTAAWLADYDTALREFERTIEAYESLGNKRGLAVTHTNRTMLLMRLGLFEEALASIERSNVLFEIAHEQRTIVANRVNESFVKLQLGDPQTAKSSAESALAMAREIAFPLFEAAALANLGNAERGLGDLARAIEHMEAGVAIRRTIQEARDYVDDLADLTLAYAEAGRAGDARNQAEELRAAVSESSEGALWPHYAWWAAGRGLAAGGDAERAAEAEARARDELLRFAGRISDDRMREAFLSIPVNARIAGRIEPAARHEHA
jgi:predicted ATPase/DNA-binding SARP family transcriptional activator